MALQKPIEPFVSWKIIFKLIRSRMLYQVVLNTLFEVLFISSPALSTTNLLYQRTLLRLCERWIRSSSEVAFGFMDFKKQRGAWHSKYSWGSPDRPFLFSYKMECPMNVFFHIILSPCSATWRTNQRVMYKLMLVATSQTDVHWKFTSVICGVRNK